LIILSGNASIPIGYFHPKTRRTTVTVKELMNKLQADIEFQLEKDKVRGDHYREKRESQALGINRKAWVYALADDAVRYVGVSFYPDYQASQVLKGGQDALGEWIREKKPALIRLEEVSQGDMAKRVKSWRRSFKGALITRTRKVAVKNIEDMTPKELLERLSQQLGET